MQKIGITCFVFYSCLFQMTAQCDVKSRIGADQTMYTYIPSELFFFTEAKSLKGNITTDKQNYFLRFSPKPFPSKEEGKELKHTVKITLSNDSTVILENFDVEYRSRDTSLSLMYLIPKKLVPLFMKHDIKSVSIDLADAEGPRNYIFVLHKATLREQLQCLMDMK